MSGVEQRQPYRTLRVILLALVALCCVTACSIESHDSRMDHCLKGHDVPNGGNPYFVCDDYALPLKDQR
jgi:hypothetical protein